MFKKLKHTAWQLASSALNCHVREFTGLFLNSHC